MPRLFAYGSFALFLSACVATVTEEAARDGVTPPPRSDGGPADTSGRIRVMDDVDSSRGPDPTPDTGATDVCEPACGGRDCGEDGCGGSCGTCAAGASCNGGTCELPPPAADCPPRGPTGSSPGVIATDITLYDCDGTATQSHSACGTPVYVYSHSEACGSCITYARNEANMVARELDAVGTDYWFIVTIGRGVSPSASDCARVRDEYGLEMPVYFVRDMWDFAEAYGSTGAGPGALLDADHQIVMLGSAKSRYERSSIMDAAAGL